MAGFSDRDIRNEIARIFKSEVTPNSDKGVVDKDSAYEQTMDIAALTFLTNPDSVFYLAQLAVKELLIVTRKEIALVEDMLFALDYVTNKYPDYRGATTELNNATTALLALDAATSVKNRPELARFTKNITAFSERMRATTAREGSLALSAGEAKWSIRQNFEELQRRHEDLLSRIGLLVSLLANYEELDIPSRAAQTMLTNVRLSINRVLSTLEVDSVSSIGEKTKSILLRSLAGKASINYLAAQKEQSLIRYRGPANSTEEVEYFGRVTGEGEAAYVQTTSGPWETPLSDLVLKVDSGAAQTFTLEDIPGVSLTSRNKGDFGIGSDAVHLHLALDLDAHEFLSNDVVASGTVNSLWLLKSGQDPFLSIGHKHLGCPLFFGADFYDSSVPGSEWDNVFPAVIEELTLLATYTTPISWASATSEFTVTGLTKTKGGAAVFNSEDVGRYIKDGSGNRYEILAVTAPDTVVLDTYGGTPNTSIGGELRGQDGPTTSHTVEFDAHPTDQPLWVQFSPNLTSAPSGHAEWEGVPVTIGPAVKSALLAVGDWSAAQIVTTLNTSGAGSSYDCFLWRHVRAQIAVSDASKIQLLPRTRVSPQLTIVDSALLVNSFTRQSGSFLGQSAHATLGFLLGTQDSDEIVQPQELADFLNASLTGAIAEVVDEVVYEGTCRTVFGTSQIVDTSVSFITLGAVAGYQVELQEGVAAGYYRVDAVPDATHLTLRRDNFPAYEDVAYRLLRQRVKITTDSKERGTSIQVTAAPAALGLPSAIQYGSTLLFEAVDEDGNALDFKKVKAGDILTIQNAGDFTISGPGTYQLEVSTPIPTWVDETQFSIQNSSYEAYETLKESLSLFTSSRALLGKHKLSEGLDILDAAISPVVATGSFVAGVNRAARILADLLALLTSSPRRSSEYSTSVPTASMNLEDILNTFSAAEVPALKALAEDMRGRQYARSVDLLLKGDITGFFEADREDASYSGAMAKATRTVIQDLPELGTDEYSVSEEANEPVEDFENPNNPDFTFQEDDDWEIEPEDDGDF